MKTFILAAAILLVAAQAATLGTIIDSLEDDSIRRCGSGCNKNFIKSTLNYLLAACRTGHCAKDWVIRTNALGSASHIQEFCVVSESFHSPNWSMRIQADLIPGGARMVLVAVPRSTRTELEKFTRPFVISDVIPRSQLFIVNQMIRSFCGLTN